jgi:hypothetical protein
MIVDRGVYDEPRGRHDGRPTWTSSISIVGPVSSNVVRAPPRVDERNHMLGDRVADESGTLPSNEATASPPSTSTSVWQLLADCRWQTTGGRLWAFVDDD